MKNPLQKLLLPAGALALLAGFSPPALRAQDASAPVVSGLTDPATAVTPAPSTGSAASASAAAKKTKKKHGKKKHAKKSPAAPAPTDGSAPTAAAPAPATNN